MALTAWAHLVVMMAVMVSTGPEQPTGFLADVTLSLHKGYRRKPLKLK